jgi:hypothetical protein
MIRAVTIMLLLTCAALGHAEEVVKTREEIFAPLDDPRHSSERRYFELDFNGDTNSDLVISESVSLGGTGGLIYNLYLGIGSNQYRHLDRFLAGVMSLDTNGNRRILWSYSHSSAGSGTIQHRSLDRKGRLEVSPALMIYPGDGGSDKANGIFNLLFGDTARLKPITIGASNNRPELTGAPLRESPDAQP